MLTAEYELPKKATGVGNARGQKRVELWRDVYLYTRVMSPSGIFSCVFKDHIQNCEQRGLCHQTAAENCTSKGVLEYQGSETSQQPPQPLSRTMVNSNNNNNNNNNSVSSWLF